MATKVKGGKPEKKKTPKSSFQRLKEQLESANKKIEEKDAELEGLKNKKTPVNQADYATKMVYDATPEKGKWYGTSDFTATRFIDELQIHNSECTSEFELATNKAEWRVRSFNNPNIGQVHLIQGSDKKNVGVKIQIQLPGYWSRADLTKYLFSLDESILEVN